MGRVAGAAVGALMLQACTHLAVDEPRAARASLTCMHVAIGGDDLAARPDHEAHCIAAGLIARRCSISEAWLASFGKELRDLFGRGDAQWLDLHADRRGIDCARSATARSDLIQCCEHPIGSEP